MGTAVCAVGRSRGTGIPARDEQTRARIHYFFFSYDDGEDNVGDGGGLAGACPYNACAGWGRASSAGAVRYRNRENISRPCPAAAARDMCANEKERGHQHRHTTNGHDSDNDDDDGSPYFINIYWCAHAADYYRLTARAKRVSRGHPLHRLLHNFLQRLHLIRERGFTCIKLYCTRRNEIDSAPRYRGSQVAVHNQLIVRTSDVGVGGGSAQVSPVLRDRAADTGDPPHIKINFNFCNVENIQISNVF